jgi:hypothetical protein
VETQTDLGLEISSLALVDTHEHLLPEDQWAGDNARLIEGMREAGEPGWGDASPDILQDLFMNYVPSDLEVAGATKEALRRLFDPAAGDIEGPFQVREVSPSDRAKMELLELGEAGFRIFRPGDLDWTHEPWLVAKDDGTVWTLAGGMPLPGYRPNTNAVLVGKNNSWAYLTTAAASGIGNAPRDLAELNAAPATRKSKPRVKQSNASGSSPRGAQPRRR